MALLLRRAHRPPPPTTPKRENLFSKQINTVLNKLKQHQMKINIYKKGNKTEKGNKLVPSPETERERKKERWDRIRLRDRQIERKSETSKNFDFSSLSTKCLILLKTLKMTLLVRCLSTCSGPLLHPSNIIVKSIWTMCMEWFQNRCLLSLVIFTKKSWKLLLELWCIALRDKPPEKNTSSFKKHCDLDLRM